MSVQFVKHLFTVSMALLAVLGGRALALEAPQGPVLLTVTGNIANTNVGNEARFDRQMLLALTQRDTATHTPWHDGRVVFSGPLGRAVLEAVGAQGTRMRVTALNDYAATVPMADFYEHDVILAMSADGRRLRIRDQGPLFVIYPFDEAPELLNETVMTRSVWQVTQIDIE
ncbi:MULTISPECIES: molybdopterin-dependent oxidoreductase [Modicisalibacter]|uniref:molybdopterin-dependent oxidoreductase n=1 Tax=Modicisalibacter TaxID=574347 RepID=UPI00100B461F|nr:MULTISPECIES: molybdopterin-dependent oxidoreductase [Halomonadaceae]MBZ9559618.1 molybdopterin-dependent oxidoreductase [Modicisalibacter sp. R2A 31.J]MBZ9577070.1 molybdopterin-dependent oxidoreductase [Modicisalibacter sp. MOD 31.J]